MLKSPDNIYLVVFLGMTGMFLLSGAIILFYVQYQKKLYQQQQEMKEAELNYQVQILHSTIQSQEDERRRIGQDLHDEVGSSLANLRIVISKIGKAESPDVRNALVSNCQSLTDTVINNVRHISHNLSPSGMELFGFADILAELCDRTSKSSGLEIMLNNETGKRQEHIDLKISIALYRVMQELLTNTIKHAGAKNVAITLSHKDDLLTLDYADDGKGLDEQVIRNKGIGMYNIESRLSMVHAKFTMGNAGQKGFNIHIQVPMSSAS